MRTCFPGQLQPMMGVEGCRNKVIQGLVGHRKGFGFTVTKMHSQGKAGSRGERSWHLNRISLAAERMECRWAKAGALRASVLPISSAEYLPPNISISNPHYFEELIPKLFLFQVKVHFAPFMCVYLALGVLPYIPQTFLLKSLPRHTPSCSMGSDVLLEAESPWNLFFLNLRIEISHEMAN